MATTRRRTQEDVRRDIAHEREELVRAMTALRGDLHAAANVKPLLRKLATGAGIAVAVVVTSKLVRGIVRRRRRRRDS